MVTKKCIECDEKSANYNYEGKQPLYCAKCKEEGMVHLKVQRCPECGKVGNFNYYGEAQGLYCKIHKDESMVDVRSKRCVSCDKQPGYALPGKKATHCIDCKLPDMVETKNKKCLECSKRPAYNYKGEKIPTHCFDHKKEDMINVVSARCKKCDKIASYNIKGQRAEYCIDHATSEMTDVRHKRCLECESLGSYGNHIIGGDAHCAKHADKKTEWRVKRCKRCKREMALFSSTGALPYEFCETCMPIGYKSNLGGTCKKCGLSNLILDANGDCIDSCSEMCKERLKRTENMLRDLLVKNDISFTDDKRIEHGCSRYRPDFVIDREDGIIIIENDEHQHRSYSCECEQLRMIQIFQDFGGLPVYFIRFNPDSYRSKTPETLANRHKFLIKYLKNILKDKNIFENRNLFVTYLFYDNYRGIVEIQDISF